MLNLQDLPDDAIKQYLKEAKRAELQLLFKRYGLKGANQKSELLIKSLLEYIMSLKSASGCSDKPPSTPKPSATKPSGIPKSVRRNLLDSPFVALNVVEARDASEQEATIIELRARIAELEAQLAAAVDQPEVDQIGSPRQQRLEASVDSDPGEVKIAEKRDISRAPSPEPQKEAEKITSTSAGDHWLSTIFRNPLTPASTPVKNLSNTNKVKAPQTEPKPTQLKKKALPRRLSLVRATAALTLGTPSTTTISTSKEESPAMKAFTAEVSPTLPQALTSEPSPPLVGFGWFQPSA